MHDVLLINASPRADSVGLQLANELAERLAQGAEPGSVTLRDLNADPLMPVGNAYATALTRRTPAQEAVFDLSERLIAEIEGSHAVVIATPMHNFTVPAALKLWIDYVVRIGRTFAALPEGKVGLLEDRPVYVLVSSGGFHRGPDARQPDFLTDYLAHVLQTIGLRDTRFVYLQGLAQGAEATALACAQARTALGCHAPLAEPHRH